MVVVGGSTGGGNGKSAPFLPRKAESGKPKGLLWCRASRQHRRQGSTGRADARARLAAMVSPPFDTRMPSCALISCVLLSSLVARPCSPVGNLRPLEHADSNPSFHLHMRLHSWQAAEHLRRSRQPRKAERLPQYLLEGLTDRRASEPVCRRIFGRHGCLYARQVAHHKISRASIARSEKSGKIIKHVLLATRPVGPLSYPLCGPS